MALVGINGYGFVPGTTGGNEMYFRDLVRALGAHGASHEYLVFLRGPVVSAISTSASNVRILPVREPRPLTRRVLYRLGKPPLDLKAQWRRTLNESRLDVLHFPFSGLVPGEIDVPAVCTIHDLQHEAHPEFFTAAEREGRTAAYRRAVDCSAHVIAVSTFTRDMLIDIYGADPARVTAVHEACDVEFWAARSDTPVRLPARYLFYPAATWPHKNHRRLLEAFAAIGARHRDLHLVLSGLRMRAADDVERATAELGLRERVVHLGYVGRSQLRTIYKKAVALVFPSLFEGFGIPLLEAMASGCPIVASDAASIPEVAGDAALYFNPLDVDEIAARIGDAVEQPDLRSILVESGLRRIRDFSPARLGRETTAVYDTVLRSGSGAGA